MQLTADEVANLRLVLKRIAFLEHLKVNELDALIEALDKRPFQKDEVIIKQGATGETFYILASGAVAVYRDRVFSRKKIAELTANGFFGEMALIDDAKRSATVIGQQAGEIYFLPREVFKKVLLNNPGIGTLIRQTADFRRSQNRALGTL